MPYSKSSNYCLKISLVLIGIIFFGIIFHAPLIVFMTKLIPGKYSLLVKGWKECLMLVVFFLLLFCLIRDKKLAILKDKLIILGIIYIGFCSLISLVKPTNLTAITAGLMIDLRYIAFFLLVYVLLKLKPNYIKYLMKLFIIGAFVITGFAFLQVTILPKDFLSILGYSQNTIMPYLTIDKNSNFIRINSTLRGPNPLGAYSLMVICFCIGKLIKEKLNLSKKQLIECIVLFALAVVSLYNSYSRSAWLALMFVTILMIIIINKSKIKVKQIIIIAIVSLCVVTGLALFAKTKVGSNLILHQNPDYISSSKSDTGHISSVNEAVKLILKNPLGYGVGSANSASLYTSKPIIIENQFLMIAYEIGFIGLAVFLLLLFAIFKQLLIKSDDYLSLIVFCSGIGLIIIGLTLPVFTDDMVSIIWFGLASLALSKRGEKVIC